jgi:glutamyl-tRNA synthetase
LIVKLQKLVKGKHPNETLNITDDHVKTVLDWALIRITKVEELVSPKFGFLWILPTKTHSDVDRRLLGKLVENLESVNEFEQDILKKCLKEFASNNNVKFPVLMKMLRSVLSGLSEGPGVTEMMNLLGKNQSLERIKAGIR